MREETRKNFEERCQKRLKELLYLKSLARRFERQMDKMISDLECRIEAERRRIEWCHRHQA